ncbi:MAG: hypothetical protein JWQ04_3228, partial [Pedosphaera sp.]|nr:hypothetical protein [Pedosphaera sp.]
HPRVELIGQLDTIEADGRISDKVTDEAGRFAGGGRGQHEIRAAGERHNLVLEFERRAVGQLARSINQFIKRENSDDPVYFAAHKEINGPILQQLDPAVRARIEKVVPEDLTKINGLKLLAHF